MLFKNISKLVAVLSAILLLLGCQNIDQKFNSEISIIPAPLELKANKGLFKINEQTQIIINFNDLRRKSKSNLF
jgi:hypothetical protein